MGRVSKENYYLDIAQTVSARGTCLRRKFGAIIVKNDSIVSTGYAGAPIGGTTCCQMCKRLVINAGIERVIVREDAERYTVYMVRDWVENDDSLGQIGY